MDKEGDRTLDSRETRAEEYPFRSVERNWRRFWESNSAHHVDLDNPKRKFYVLVMFSYPSEKKLHIGHWYNYAPADTFARLKRMQGWNVFEPMGFDAFGLPAENYAIKHGVHPARTTRDSVNYIREQLKAIGAMYDWSREVDTSRPEYYRWTQWLFLQLFKAGAAYRKQAPVNWCPQCQTVLANEQVLSNGTCERCGTSVTVRDLEQWFFRITDFADDLLQGLNRIDWPEPTKAMQRHWIGRSEGTEVHFPLENHPEALRCFTTRADTIFGVTYLVVAPEHPSVSRLVTAEQAGEVEAYIRRARESSEIERLSTEREKTGVFTGSYAFHPITGERLPIWVGDFVVGTYGTGAVMAVPAHDQRDFDFARRYNLPVKWVIRPENPHDEVFVDRAYTEYGVMQNSGEFSGLSSEAGIRKVSEWLKTHGKGGPAVSYRLRDWLISRQRYWGAPIPIIHCEVCGLVPVPESDLPVLLPETGVDFTPRGTSPLGSCESFIHAKCPKCGRPARRDPDTMDTFVCSSWYYLRYVSTDDHTRPFNPERVNRWLPVDVYVGGPEHATGHLIYARYITKFLHSQGFLKFDEPFRKLVHQGIITHKGQRMSKSKGNVVNPDAFVDRFGSDCFRLYMMFMGDYTEGGDWSDEGIVGIRRFQNRIWRLFQSWAPRLAQIEGSETNLDRKLNRIRHYTIREVTADVENFRFNTAISRLMEYLNALYDYCDRENQVDPAFLKTCLVSFNLLLAPLAPHMGEELWNAVGGKGSVFDQPWPNWDESALQVTQTTVVVQVNGKLVDRVVVGVGTDVDQVAGFALDLPKVRKHVSGRRIVKKVFVPDRLLNLVVE